jgi:hypothetical protein
MRGRQSGTRFGPFRPAVERLEERDVPAAILSGTNLVITGNTITILDDGSNSATDTKAVTVTTNDGGTQTFAGNVVLSITVNGNPGGDSVTYVLGGSGEPRQFGMPPTPSGPSFLTDRGGRFVTFNLDASRRDNLLLFMQPNQTLVAANYSFNINQLPAARGKTPAGINVQVGANGLVIDANSSMNISINGGSGNDTISADLAGVDVGPTASTNFPGSPPPPTVPPGTTPPAISPGSSRFSINVNGNGGTDQILVYIGVTSDSQGSVTGSVTGGSSKSTLALVSGVGVSLPGAGGNPSPTKPFLTLSNGGTGFASVIPFVNTSNLKQLIFVF